MTLREKERSLVGLLAVCVTCLIAEIDFAIEKSELVAVPLSLMMMIMLYVFFGTEVITRKKEEKR